LSTHILKSDTVIRDFEMFSDKTGITA